MTTLEDLPPTVLLDILEYLSALDRYRALHNLNRRLNGIVRHSTTHISLSNIQSRDNFEYYLKYILPDIINNLRYLKISNDFIFDLQPKSIIDQYTAIMFGVIKKVQAKINLLTYRTLEVLELENITATQMQLISDKITQMSHLKYVTISFRGTLSDAFKAIFNNDVLRPILRKLYLTLLDADVSFPQTSAIQHFVKLERLIIDSCRVQNLIRLCPFVENITYLNIKIWDFPDQRSSNLNRKFHFPNLIHLKLKVDEVRWPFVEHFLRQCGEKLKYFTFIGMKLNMMNFPRLFSFLGDNDLNFVNSTNWQSLITNYLTQLAKFEFYVILWDASINDVNLSLFDTNFWRQLNVNIACGLVKGAYANSADTIHVYTLPFCDSFIILAPSARSVIVPPTTNTSFNRVQTALISLDDKPFRGTTHSYENVNSILLQSPLRHRSEILPFIRPAVNPNKIHHLGFQSVRAVLQIPIFIQLLEQCPNIYSLNIHSKILIEMTNEFSNERVCLLLQKMIKQIQCEAGVESEDFNNPILKKFVETFANVERLYIHMESSENIMINLPFMIQNMNKLNMIFIKTRSNISNGFIDQMKESILELKDSYIRKEKSFLFIWC